MHVQVGEMMSGVLNRMRFIDDITAEQIANSTDAQYRDPIIMVASELRQAPKSFVMTLQVALKAPADLQKQAALGTVTGDRFCPPVGTN